MFAFNFTSPLFCKHIVKQSNPVFRNLSLLQRMKPRPVLLDKSKHEVIYEFPYITQTCHIIKTKFWLPAIATFIVPMGLLFDKVRVPIIGAFCACLLHGAVMHLVSDRIANLVGRIYVNKENESKDLIISAIDVDGNRIDRCHNPNDLIICDFSSKTSHALGFIRIYSENTKILYLINISSCKIYSAKDFALLCGQKYCPEKEA